MMMKSDLPLDLIEEILSRVPATSVKRLLSTCKRWNALFKDQRFTKKHFSKAPKESMILMSKEYRVFPVNVNLNVAPPSIDFKGALGLKDSHSNAEQVDIVQVFHCDGFLLCTTKDNRLVVWNPCLGETKWIQLKADYVKDGSRFTLGYIQNNKSCRSYKILRRWGCMDYERFAIYEFSSNSWRVLDDVFLGYVIQRKGYSSGASSLKGNTYWVASRNIDKYKCLLSFDFTEESFKHLCLPPFQNHGCVTLSVSREEQLSALNRSYEASKIEMWVTNKIDIESELLWSKSFVVDSRVGNCFNIFTSLLIDEEKKVSLCCSLGEKLVYTIGEDDGYYTEIPYISNSRWWSYSIKWRPLIFNYVPSLFQIQ
ncbi:unnamed protein product [Arabidopsis lyrata]|nr:unnamed protein product [Arabidopsis lyrata]